MKKTKPSLKELIRKGGFGYVNPGITPENFPPQEISSDYRIFHFDRYISSDDADSFFAEM